MTCWMTSWVLPPKPDEVNWRPGKLVGAAWAGATGLTAAAGLAAAGLTLGAAAAPAGAGLETAAGLAPVDAPLGAAAELVAEEAG